MVSFSGNAFTVKSGDEVSGETAALLNGISGKMGMSLEAGSVLYLRDTLYVYNGWGKWRKVVARSTKKGKAEYERLMSGVKEKYEE